MSLKIPLDNHGLRDNQTPDFFHSLTESELDAIATHLANDPTSRFKDCLSHNFVKQFIIQVVEFNPSMILTFKAYNNKSKRLKKILKLKR